MKTKIFTLIFALFIVSAIETKASNQYRATIDGPDAPELTIRELDKQLIIYLSNPETSNNINENYIELDPSLVGPLPSDSTQQKDPYFRFEGYKVYQLADETVTFDELDDSTKARLIFQCDVKNHIRTITNYIYDETLHHDVPTVMVYGLNTGIKHSFLVNYDEFYTYSHKVELVNDKPYYFMAVAYAYNNFMTYTDDPCQQYTGLGQKTPYLEGKNNVKVYTAVPHVVKDASGAIGSYDEPLEVTRWVGIGNGGNEIEMSDEDVEELLSKQPANYTNGAERNIFGMETYPVIYHPKYKKNHAPIDVRVIDPLSVVATDYAIYLDDFQDVMMYNVTDDESINGDSTKLRTFSWVLEDLNTGEKYYPDKTTENVNEQLFSEIGLAVNISQSWDFGPIHVGSTYYGSVEVAAFATLSPDNGIISSSVTYADESNKWLGGIRDSDVVYNSPLNWIRSGTYIAPYYYDDYDDYFMRAGTYGYVQKPYDPDENYENIASGSWAPYYLANYNDWEYSPGVVFPPTHCKIDSIFHKMGSIDIVLTADKSKWTRCPVVEMCLDDDFSEGNVKRFGLRDHASVDKDGNYAASKDMQPSENPDDPNYISARGMGWFPGYVIDIETGARLNVIFGEDSRYPELNGRDMLFNPPALKESTVNDHPSDQVYDPVVFDQTDYTPIFGAKHFVYVFPMVDTKVQGNTTIFHTFGCPAYDAGRSMHETLHWMDSVNKIQYNVIFWGMPTWVGLPMAIEGRQWLPDDNPVKISVRVNVPYRPGYGTMQLDTTMYDANIRNGFNPCYTFSTAAMVSNPILTYSSDLEGYVTAVCNGDFVDSGDKLPNYSAVCVLAKPFDETQKFYGWTDAPGGNTVSTDNPYYFNITKNTKLYANFSEYGLGESDCSRLTAFPNPAKVGQKINFEKECDKIQIINEFGTVIAEYNDTDYIDGIDAKGAYIVKVNIGESVGYVKIVVE